MKPSDFQKTIQCQFDCKLKRVVKGIVRNYRKELKRRRNKEISYCELPEIVVEKLAVWDEYESDCWKSRFATTYPHRIMIRPHGAVLPTRMGIVEILMELSKAVCLLVKK